MLLCSSAKSFVDKCHAFELGGGGGTFPSSCKEERMTQNTVRPLLYCDFFCVRSKTTVRFAVSGLLLWLHRKIHKPRFFYDKQKRSSN